MLGTDGFEGKNLVRLTWEQFQEWQRWDEFPERCADPPMTVDMSFIYKDRLYYLDMINHKYVILTAEWDPIATDDNFLALLKKPIEIWSGKTFCEELDEMQFVN